MNMFSKLERAVTAIEQTLMGWLALGALVLACIEMFMRYFFPSQLPDWTSEVVIYQITAAVLASGGVLVKEGRHVHADLFIKNLPAKTRKMLNIFFSVVGCAFAVVMAKAGGDVVGFAYRLGETSDSSLQFPLYIYYLIIPTSFALIAFHYLILTYRLIFSVEEKQDEGSEKSEMMTSD